MFELDLYNKFKKTYLLLIEETEYGYSGRMYLAPGLSFEALKDKRKTIEQNLRCLWIMRVEQLSEFATVQIVTMPLSHELPYTNPKIRPWEMYLGLDFAGELQKNDNNDACMFLLAGAVGSGKTRFIYLVLLSWILGCTPKDVWLYISDIAKNEYVQFRNVQHVKAYASELDELVDMMKAVRKEFNRRKGLISRYREQGTATNISEYNKIKGNHLPYCYILIDEFSVILPDKTDSKAEKEQKEFILDTLKYLSKLGRSIGMFCFIATQKTTRDEIPSIIKNMSAVRISFRANDAISSEVIMGDNSAMGLADRIAVYSTNGGSIQNYLFSPKITIERLNELLAPYVKGNDKQPSQGRRKATRGKVTPMPKGMPIEEKECYIDLLGGDDYNDY